MRNRNQTLFIQTLRMDSVVIEAACEIWVKPQSQATWIQTQNTWSKICYQKGNPMPNQNRGMRNLIWATWIWTLNTESKFGIQNWESNTKPKNGTGTWKIQTKLMKNEKWNGTCATVKWNSYQLDSIPWTWVWKPHWYAKSKPNLIPESADSNPNTGICSYYTGMWILSLTPNPSDLQTWKRSPKLKRKSYLIPRLNHSELIRRARTLVSQLCSPSPESLLYTIYGWTYPCL
jgi:hypothetical protein